MMKSRSLGLTLGTLALVFGGASACGDEPTEPSGEARDEDTDRDRSEDPDGDKADPDGDKAEDTDGDRSEDTDGDKAEDPNGDKAEDSDDDENDEGARQEDCPELEQRDEVEISGEISKDTTWTCDKTYVLSDLTFIVDDSDLTIEAGTRVRGRERAALVATRGSRLLAEGTREQPIVFTSDLLEGDRGPGDWGGLVLLGGAPINTKGGVDQVEGISAGDAAGEYGGDDEQHDCGRLRYVRVEFAGYELSVDNELNGISVAGCGSQTRLEYVQVHRGSDDGIEFWGGSARAKHVVLSGIQDDSLDWDSGFRGKLQFVVVQQHDDGDAIIEADNNASENDASPRSSPTLYNATFIGGGGNGIVLRVGSWGLIRNAIIMRAPYAVDVRDAASASGAEREPARLAIENSLFFDNGEDGETHFTDDDNAGGFVDHEFFTHEERNNQFDVDPVLGDPDDRGRPDFVPAAEGAAGSGAATPPDDGFFDSSAVFIGAFQPGGEDWTQGWTAYPRD